VRAGVEPPEITLDVRGVPGDAQAAWTLAALETLADGQVLVHLNSEVPQSLFSHLTTRGYRYRIRNAEEGMVRIEIRRLARPTGHWPREPRNWTLRPCGCATVEGRAP
jgi:uncharacterized protein (DUF2249 family)